MVRPISPKPPPDLLERAAELRAEGTGWAITARMLGLDLDDLRARTQEDPQHWNALLSRARRSVIGDCLAEACVTLRSHLRCGVRKEQREAAGWRLGNVRRMASLVCVRNSVQWDAYWSLVA